MDNQPESSAEPTVNAAAAENEDLRSTTTQQVEQPEAPPATPEEDGPDPSLPSRVRVPVYYDPNARLDTLSQRIMAIELANGVGLSARQIKEIGNIAVDVDTINRRRATGAYQRVLTELRKDALELIAETQSKAIRKLREQLDSKNEKIAQRAALFFGESTMHVHMKRAEAELQLELQKRAQNFVKRTIIEFEMDPTIPVLGEPVRAPSGAGAATSGQSTTEGAAQAEGVLPTPSPGLPKPSETNTPDRVKPTESLTSSTKVQESCNNSATDSEKPITLENGSESFFAVVNGQRATIELPNNTPRVVDNPASTSSSPEQQVLETIRQDQSADSIPDRADNAPLAPEGPDPLPNGNSVVFDSDDDDILGGIND